MRDPFIIILILTLSGCAKNNHPDMPINISGVYPQLAYYNNEGECGTGSVVPWAGRLGVINYDKMPGRLTGYAAHLSNPINMIFYGTV
jgi:hypothetical protein